MFRRRHGRTELMGNRRSAWRGFAPWALVAVCLIGLLLRLKGLDSPFVDFHGWRQGDTAAVARYFYEREFNLLRPQLPYYGAPPNYAELEFSLVPAIAAGLYYIFGEASWVARTVIILFSLWSLVSVYRIGAHFWGLWPGLVAALTMAVQPFYVYFSRSFQPDVPMLALSLAALADFLAWSREGSRAHAWRGCLWLTLAVLVKPPAAIAYLPLSLWWWSAYRSGQAGSFVVGLAYLIAPLAALLIYLQSIHGIAEHPFVSGIALSFMERFWQEGIPVDWYGDVGRGIFFFVCTPVFVLPALLGCLRGLFSKERRWIVAWLAGVAAFFLLAGSHVLNNLQYYFLPAVPLAALFVGLSTEWLTVSRRGLLRRATAASLALLVLVGGAFLVSASFQRLLPERWLRYQPWTYERWYQLDDKVLKVGRALEQITPAEALLLIAEETPRSLFYSRRFGWFIPPEECSAEYLAGVRAEGAAYLVWPYEKPPTHLGGLTGEWHPEGFWLFDLGKMF
ncbi:ArnT family glycosyltransferase [Heliomicrobium modesticaldum]|nr:glycosyltransferase family 39 protein [Heliomicrobium modesticaldum]